MDNKDPLEYLKNLPNNATASVFDEHIKSAIEAVSKKEQFDIDEWHRKNAPVGNKFSKHQLNFVNESDNEDPQYKTDGASGFDLRANSEEVIPAGSYATIPTGLFFHIPYGFEIQVRPRSGLAAKHGVTVLNSPGTIDADYRGELKVILTNHGEQDFDISKGDRIAQGVVATVTASNIIKLNRVDEINTDTNRGDGGFGSTGHR